MRKRRHRRCRPTHGRLTPEQPAPRLRSRPGLLPAAPAWRRTCWRRWPARHRRGSPSCRSRRPAGGPRVGGFTADQLASFTFGDIAQLLRCDAQRAQEVVVDHDASTTWPVRPWRTLRGRVHQACVRRMHPMGRQGRQPLPTRREFRRGPVPTRRRSSRPRYALSRSGQDPSRFTAVTKDLPRGIPASALARGSLRRSDQHSGALPPLKCHRLVRDILDVILSHRHDLFRSIK